MEGPEDGSAGPSRRSGPDPPEGVARREEFLGVFGLGRIGANGSECTLQPFAARKEFRIGSGFPGIVTGD